MSTEPKSENNNKVYLDENNYVLIREIFKLFQIIEYSFQTGSRRTQFGARLHSSFAQFHKYSSCPAFHSESRDFFTKLDDYRESEFLKQSKHVTSFGTHGACSTFAATKFASKRQIAPDN